MAEANVTGQDTGAAAGADAGAAQNAGAGDAGAPSDQEQASGGRERGADGKFAARATDAAGQAEADWRAAYAADEKLAKTLSRYNTQADAFKALVNAQETISKGGHKPKPPADDAPDADKAEWRKIIGVPDKADDYKTPKIAGLEFGEGDEPLLKSLRDRFHAKGVPQSAFDAGIEWYADLIADANTAQKQAKDQAVLNCEEVLSKEWGSDYRPNMVMSDRYFDGLPNGVGEKIKALLGDDPDVRRWAASEARMFGVTPASIQRGGGDPTKGMDARIAELEAMMQDPKSAYHTNPAIEKEYVELVDNRAKMKRRAA